MRRGVSLPGGSQSSIPNSQFSILNSPQYTRRVQLLGIVGGIAPESTIEYYRSIVASWRKQTNDGSYPRLVINSIDLTRMIGLIGAGKLEEVTDMLVGEVERLARAGAEFGLFASNTPHLVFDAIAARSPIPLLSIVEETCRHAQSRGFERLGLFGTRFTMQSSFYRDRFATAGMTVISPAPDEQTYIHDIYMNELVLGVFRDETRERLVQIIDAMRERDSLDALILGGTELPLTLKEPSYSGVTTLDTTKIHVEAAVARMLL